MPMDEIDEEIHLYKREAVWAEQDYLVGRKKMRRTDTKKAGIRKAGALLLTLSMLAGSLAGCAHGEEPAEESRPKEIVLTGVLAPKAEFQTVNYDLKSLQNYVWWGDSLIWVVDDYDRELKQGRDTWMMADMAGLKDPQPVAKEDEVRGITDLFTDSSGNLYLFGREHGAEERYYLQKKDASGQEIYTVYPQADAEGPGGYEGFADSEGNVVLANRFTEMAAIIDSEGNWKGNVKIEIPVWNVGFVDGGPDGVFLASADTMEDEVQLQKVSFEDGTLGRTLTVKLPRQGGDHDLTNENAVLLGGGSMGLLLSEKDALSYFDLQEGRGEKILDWNLLEINGTFVSEIRPKEKADEKPEFEVFLAGGMFDFRGFEPEIANISWVDEGYLPQKQTLIVGEGLGLGSLDLVARRFNRSSENYRVEVEAFGFAQLEQVAVGGASVPDIIDVNVIDVALLKDKQLLEDLEPWLKKSKVISREEITDAAYEAGMLDGKLYSIVPRYSIVGVVTSGNAIGMEGFTMKDYAAKAAENPDARVNAPSNTINLLRQTLPGMMDRFVDWEKGKCKFDGKEFSEFLSLLKDMNVDLINAGGDMYNRFHSGVEQGTVLYDLFYCPGPKNYYSNITKKKDKLEMIGYPTRDREAFYTVYPQQRYAIYSKSKCKEGAWAFLEFLLSEEQQSWSESDFGGTVFPANRNALERYLTRSASEEEEAEGMEEAREAVRYMLAHAHPSQIDGRNSEIFYIISEELEAFLRGDKSLEDTADVIQRRASLYMAECM